MAAAGLAACTSDEAEAPARAAASGPPPLQPGKPGEPNSTGAPTIAPDQFSDADVAFATDMIPHHAQALEMSALVPTRGADPRVRTFAARIQAEQEPEIRLLAAWLEERDQQVPVVEGVVGDADAATEHEEHGGHSGHGSAGADEPAHDHAQMPGMASPEELAELGSLRGEAFDRRFLELMTRHHQGALTMVEQHTTGGLDVRLNEIASEVQVTQAAEIDRMQDLLPAS